MSLSTTPFRTFMENGVGAIGFKVFIAEVPEDKEIKVTNGLFTPFFAIYFGGPIRAAGDHHIVDSAKDSTIVYCTIEAYAARSSEALEMKNRVITSLTGKRPPDCGQLTLEGGMTYSRATNEVRPTMYIESTVFSTRSNLSWD